MREIKFRKYDKINNCWKYFDLHRIGYDGDYHWEDESIGEFTGLKDKNGKDIYEGDILKTDYGIGEVKYHICTFTIHGGSNLIGINNLYNCTDCGLGNAIKCEIIGNIYQNTELLK